MNLERVPNEEKLTLCRKYYLGEFIGINSFQMSFIGMRKHMFTLPKQVSKQNNTKEK